MIKDHTLDIEAKIKQRDEFLRKRRKLGRKKHSVVSVFGSGGLAEGIIHNLLEENRMYGSLDISKIYLISNSFARAEGIAGEFQDIGGNVLPRDYSCMDEIKEFSDVIVIATDNHKANAKYKSNPENITAEVREEMTKNNLVPVGKIAKMLGKGKVYDKTLVIGTNQTDRLCGFVQRTSRMDARRIVAVNQTDTIRQRNLFLKQILEHSGKIGLSPRDINSLLTFCYTIGAHDGSMVPVFSNAEYAGFDPKIMSFVSEVIAQIRPEVIMRGVEQFKKTGQIPKQAPAKAGAETIKAIITEQDCVVASTYVDFTEPLFTDDPAFDLYKDKLPSGPVYIGLPCFFWDGQAELMPQWGSQEDRERQLQWFWGLSDDDKLAFVESARQIRGTYEGWISEGAMKDISSKSSYCFTRRVDKEADYPAIDLDTIVFSLDKKNSKKVNMYRPGLSFAPKKSFSCDLGKGISSLRKLCADDKTLSALLHTSGKRGAKDSYQVVRWDIETGKAVKYKKTGKDLSSIALCGEDVVCGVNGSSNDVAVIYRKDGSEEVITAGEPMSFSSIAVDGSSVFGVSKNKIYQIDGNQLRLVAEAKGVLANPTVIHTENGIIIAASSYNQNKVYVINPAEQDITSFESKRGVYDISFTDEGNIALALVLRDKAVTGYYENTEDLMDKSSKKSSKSYEIQDIKSVHFDKDFLFIADSKGKLHLVDNEFPDETYKPVELENAWLQKSNNYAWVRKC